MAAGLIGTALGCCRALCRVGSVAVLAIGGCAATFSFRPGGLPPGPGEAGFDYASYSQPALIPYTSHSRAVANSSSGGIGLYTSAWIGGGSATGSFHVGFDVPWPSTVTVSFVMTSTGFTYAYGFGSFTGTAWRWALDDGEWHSEDIVAPFSPEVLTGKAVDLALLAAGGIAPPGEVSEAIDLIDTAWTVYNLQQNLQTMVDAFRATRITNTFTFTADAGHHDLAVGLQATSSGFVTGSAFAFVTAQIDRITVDTSTRTDLPADLVVPGVTLPASVVRPRLGVPVTLTVERANIGGASTWAENFSLHVLEPGAAQWTPIVTQRFDRAEFAPNRSRRTPVFHTFRARGTHRVIAWADESEEVAEIDDFNNHRIIDIDVIGRPPAAPTQPLRQGQPLPYGIRLHRNRPATFVTAGGDPDGDPIHFRFETRSAGGTNWIPVPNLGGQPTNGWSLSTNLVITPVLDDPDLLPESGADPRTWFAADGTHHLIRAVAADVDGTSAASAATGFEIIWNEQPSVPQITGPSTVDTLAGLGLSLRTADPDGDAVAFRIDWGDAPVPAWGEWIWCPRGQTNLSVNHHYPTPGTYSVHVQATDAYSRSFDDPIRPTAAAAFTVTVNAYVPPADAVSVVAWDSGTGQPLPGVPVVVSGPTPTSGLTGADGSFRAAVLPGAYAVTFGPMDGFVTPAPVSGTVSPGGRLAVEGRYAHAIGQLRLESNIEARGEVTGFGTAGGIRHEVVGSRWILAYAWAGGYSVRFDPVDDPEFARPIPSTTNLTLLPSAAAVVQGRYIRRPRASLGVILPESSSGYLPPDAFVVLGEDLVTFDGSASWSPPQPRGPGPPHSFPELVLTNRAYRFRFDDGRHYRESADIAGDGVFDGRTVHAFSRSGRRRVELFVEDSTGTTNRQPAWTEILVKERPVALPLIEPNPAIAGEWVGFAGGWEDPDPGDRVDAWEWGIPGEGLLESRVDWSTNRIRVGRHPVSLRVRGDDRVWSRLETRLLEVLPPRQWPGFKANPARTAEQPVYPDREQGLVDHVPAGGAWPRATDGPVRGSVVAADLDGDPVNGLEIAFVSTVGTLQVTAADGALLWSATVGPSSATPAIGDIDGDGVPEVVVGSRRGLHAFDQRGNRVLYRTNAAFEFSNPVLADIVSASPGLEIVAVSDDGSIHAVRTGGLPLPTGWIHPVSGPADPDPLFSPGPAVADIAQSHEGPEVIVGGGDGVVYVLAADGVLVASLAVPGLPRFRTTPAVADVVPAVAGQEIVLGGDDGILRCINYRQGVLTPLWQHAVSPPAPIRSSPAIGVAGESPHAQIAFGADNGVLTLLQGTNGAVLGTFSAGAGVRIRSSPAIANIDSRRNRHPVLGDLPEVLFGTDDGRMIAVSFALGARLVWQFPLTPAGEPVHGSPAVADLDHDPDLEILVGADDGRVHVFDAVPDPLQAPVAGFTAGPLSGPAPLTVAFTNTTTGGPTWMEWDFGDDGASSDTDPRHTYDEPGTYTVRLTVRNPHGGDTLTRSRLITVVPAPVASFSASPLIGAAPLSVRFRDESIFSPTGWSWDFGDGGTATEADPVHIFQRPGRYTVVLTVTNPHGGDQRSVRDLVEVLETPPESAWAEDTRWGTAPLTVSFTDRSTGEPDRWLWRFGDGTGSDQVDPVHVYARPGRYLVQLTVGNAAGESSRTAEEFLTVLPAAGPSEEAVLDLPFDEGDGSQALDRSSFGNHGTLHGAGWIPGGLGGFALGFSGGGQWVDGDALIVPASPSLDLDVPFVIDAEIRAHGDDPYLAIVDRHGGGPGLPAGYTLYLDAGRLRLSLYSGDAGIGDCIGTTDLRDGGWHGVRGAWDGSRMTVEVDGVTEGSVPWGHPPSVPADPVPLGIGKRLGGWGGYLPFLGAIDAVLIRRIDPGPEPTLTIERIGGETLLLWNVEGSLESAADIQGPWSVLQRPDLPYRIPEGADRRFYRMR